MNNDIRSSSPSPDAIRQLFLACDLNGDGFIDRYELAEICNELNEDELYEIFMALDIDGDGRISVQDFTSGFDSVSDTLLSLSRMRRRKKLRQQIPVCEFEEFLGKMGSSFDFISCQEQVCELYQQLHQSQTPRVLSQYEKVVYEILKDIRQQQSEIDRLEKSLKRANDANADHLRQLELDSEGQAQRLEQRIRQEERERTEADRRDTEKQLKNEIQELEANLKKYQQAEETLQTRDKPRDEKIQSLHKTVEDLRKEKRILKSNLTELQTALALSRSENLELRSEYEDQMGFITTNRETLHEYIKEHENLTRQLQMLHEANKKLQDTNDDLREALENTQRNARITPHANRLAHSRSNSFPRQDSDSATPVRRRQNQFYNNVDQSEIPMGSRHGNYGFQQLDGDYPDDVDSGNSTLRDPNELLDLDGDEDQRRPAPISEELFIENNQRIHSPDHQKSQSANERASHSRDYVTSPKNDSLKRLPKQRTSPVQQDNPFQRQGSDRSSSSSTSRSGRHRKRALPQIPTKVNKPIAAKVPQGAPERMYKVVLAGDAAVGKSSFILRLCKGIFHKSLNSTLGVDFQVRTMEVDGRVTSVQLWDTAGQERFRSIAKSYFRRADGVLLLYDCTYERSFINVRDWIEAVEDGAHKNIPIMICANKVDMRAECVDKGVRCVRREDGERLANSFGALFIEVSAKNNTNIEEAAEKLVRRLHENEDIDLGNNGLKLSSTEAFKKEEKFFSCCDT